MLILALLLGTVLCDVGGQVCFKLGVGHESEPLPAGGLRGFFGGLLLSPWIVAGILVYGFHAEHHYRPKVHWTRMVQLRDSIRDEQRAHGVHVMDHCHDLGFLDRKPAQYTQIGRTTTNSA
jgi:hypothetical protein